MEFFASLGLLKKPINEWTGKKNWTNQLKIHNFFVWFGYGFKSLKLMLSLNPKPSIKGYFSPNPSLKLSRSPPRSSLPSSLYLWPLILVRLEMEKHWILLDFNYFFHHPRLPMVFACLFGVWLCVDTYITNVWGLCELPPWLTNLLLSFLYGSRIAPCFSFIIFPLSFPIPYIFPH
jgi:hypothetical protein